MRMRHTLTDLFATRHALSKYILFKCIQLYEVGCQRMHDHHISIMTENCKNYTDFYMFIIYIYISAYLVCKAPVIHVKFKMNDVQTRDRDEIVVRCDEDHRYLNYRKNAY